MTYLYRFHEKSDEPDLVRFWCEQSGWDQLDLASWRDRFMRFPGGEARFCLMIEPETDQIVGQLIFVPVRLRMGDREVMAYRPAAPVVAKRLRGSILSTIQLYQSGLEALRSESCSVVYLLPHPISLPLFRRLPRMFQFHTGFFPLWSLSLTGSDAFQLPPGFVASPLDTWNTEIDRLWGQMMSSYRCSPVRDARSLQARVGRGEHEVTQVRRNGELVGLVAGRQKGTRQWLLDEVLAADHDHSLKATILAACQVASSAAQKALAAKPIHKVALVGNSPMQQTLMALQFNREKYEFPLIIQKVDPGLSDEDIAPKGWLVSAID